MPCVCESLASGSPGNFVVQLHGYIVWSFYLLWGSPSPLTAFLPLLEVGGEEVCLVILHVGDIYSLVVVVHQDVGFPYMLDERHPDDTLFLYFEADMRWYQGDCLTLMQWLPMCVMSEDDPEKQEDAAPRPGAASSSSAGASRPAASKEPKGKGKGKGNKPRVPGRCQDLEQNLRPEGPVRECSEELFEIVQCCNQASRHGHGEVVWLGYNCAGEGASRPYPMNVVGFGSQLICFTKKSARAFLKAMEKDTPMHIDLYFKWYLEKAVAEPLACDEVFQQSCHVVPPLGNFLSHVSGCSTGQERPGFWHHDWCVEGTLSQPGPEGERYLRRFSRKTKQQCKICDLTFPTDCSNHWKTRKPPRSQCYTDDTFYNILVPMEYMNEAGWYHGPPWQPYEQKQYDAKIRKGEPLASLPKTWHQLLREAPDEVPDVEEMSLPHKRMALTRLQRVVCCHIVGQPAEFKKATDRRYRRYKQWVRLHEQRFFVDYREREAVSHHAYS